MRWVSVLVPAMGKVAAQEVISRFDSPVIAQLPENARLLSHAPLLTVLNAASAACARSGNGSSLR